MADRSYIYETPRRSTVSYSPERPSTVHSSGHAVYTPRPIEDRPLVRYSRPRYSYYEPDWHYGRPRTASYWHPADYHYAPATRYVSQDWAPSTYRYSYSPQRYTYVQQPPPTYYVEERPVVVAAPPPPPPPPAPARAVYAVLGIDVKFEDYAGGIDNVVAVHNIVKGGPADVAGVQPEDVIVNWDGAVIDGKDRWHDLMRTARPGEPIRFSINRSGFVFDAVVVPSAWNCPRNRTYTVSSPRRERHIRQGATYTRASSRIAGSESPQRTPRYYH